MMCSSRNLFFVKRWTLADLGSHVLVLATRAEVAAGGGRDRDRGARLEAEGILLEVVSERRPDHPAGEDDGRAAPWSCTQATHNI